MQWTLELNDLLNQCVFECGYEFSAACSLLQSRARTLRLLSEGECRLTADACQVQWMAINPMDDAPEDDDDEGNDDGMQVDACIADRAEDAGFQFVEMERTQQQLERQHQQEDEYEEQLYHGHLEQQHHHYRQQQQESDASPARASRDTSRATASATPGTAPEAGRQLAQLLLGVESALCARESCDQETVGTSDIAPSPPAPRQPSPRSTSPLASPPTPPSAYPLYECAPLLELSISDAELDLLISSLPAPRGPEDDVSSNCYGDVSGATTRGARCAGDRDSRCADAKHRPGVTATAATRSAAPASEMQWVLSFLTDPEDVARHDAEAKSLLETADKREDDNYQYFLCQLSDANLLQVRSRSDGVGEDSMAAEAAVAGSKSGALDATSAALDSRSTLASKLRGAETPVAALDALRLHCDGKERDSRSNDGRESDEGSGESDGASDSDEDADWEVVRQSIKSKAAGRPAAGSQGSAAAVVSCDAPPTSGARSTAAPEPHRTHEGSHQSPPVPVSSSRAATHSSRTRLTRSGENAMDSANTGAGAHAHREALSREIGDLLKTHGEFQFPKRMFPHHNDVLAQPEA